jgi:hypothetical protein
VAKYFQESWLVERDCILHSKALSVFRAGFIKGKRTTGKVFIIKTTIDKYLRLKRERLYWCSLNFEKAFDSIHREAVQYKWRRKGISDNMVKCIKECVRGLSFVRSVEKTR